MAAPIKINIKEQSDKTDLSTITQLTGLDIIANPSKSYKELISSINSFDEFKSKPLAAGYQLQFYNENNQEITNNKQELEKVSKIVVKNKTIIVPLPKFLLGFLTFFPITVKVSKPRKK